MVGTVAPSCPNEVGGKCFYRVFRSVLDRDYFYQARLSPATGLDLGLKPSAGSVMYLLDDLGFMMASSENGTYSKDPDGFMSTVKLGGATYIMVTRDVIMPMSFQVYKMIMITPQVDFYGATEQSKKAVVMTGILCVVGVIIVAVAAFFAVLPLRRMAKSMEQLTKFDFTVLEGGKLESKSLITEYNRVESTFLVMVKAFEASIRANRQLISRSSGANTNSVVRRASDAKT
ncbi:hypothetical protein HDU76_004654 [Blyttiomyces sp. JEL0837]|nr:hypothetical protein HDU76_004654 [Blyttiomyces sp. JEL0837]